MLHCFINVLQLLDNAGREALEVYFHLRGWGMMRMISICTAMVNESTRAKINLVKCLGFFFYFPPSSLGPLNLFEAYLKEVLKHLC